MFFINFPKIPQSLISHCIFTHLKVKIGHNTQELNLEYTFTIAGFNFICIHCIKKQSCDNCHDGALSKRLISWTKIINTKSNT